jgi:dihydrofolate synthase/folylpolyglutamate synthase
MQDFSDDAAVEAWLGQHLDRERSRDFQGMGVEGVRATLGHLPSPPAPATIAGTKGKGSTTALLCAALSAHGERVVGFLSPHVRSVRERWTCDGRPVELALLSQAARAVAAAERAAGSAGSYFERAFLMATWLAAEGRATRLVLEVGLGGRLDATNALDCRLAVLTRLDLDHTAVLGPTLDHIAVEKLAISRPGRPLLIGPQSPAGAAAVARHLPPGVPVQWISVAADTPQPAALPGAHQRDNAATALSAAALLLEEPIDDARLRRGLDDARQAGRCQRIALPDGRRLLIDGAHTPDSLRAGLAEAGVWLRPGYTTLLGAAADKELAALAATMAGQPRVWRVGWDSPRACGPDDGPSAWRHLGPWAGSIHTALATWRHDPDAGDLLIIGSLLLAGVALQQLETPDVG